MTCNSCGGVLGRDCFNPQECAWITQQMEADQQRQYECARVDTDHRLTALENENAELRAEIVRMKSSLPNAKVSHGA